jgi:hypothetical protein
MGNRYSFTRDGLHSMELAGITAQEVYDVLHAPPGYRLTRHLDDGDATVCGTTTGRYLMVGLRESDHEDCDWDIVGARDLHTDEKTVIERYLRRQS